jgi:peptidoglycan-associated lipoprotein
MPGLFVLYQYINFIYLWYEYTMRLKPIFFLLIWSFYSCGSNTRIKDGTTAYQMKQYATAIGLLKKETEQLGKAELKSPKQLLIGKCYVKLLDYPQALEWFVLAEKNNHGPEATLQKAYTLKNLMKYDQAIASFEGLRSISSIAQEAKRQIEICKSLLLLQSQTPSTFNIEKIWSDSYYSDYGAVNYDDDFLVISSDREESTGGKRYNWTGNKYSDLYLVDKESRSVKRFDSVINTEANEGTPCFTKDFQTMIFTRCFGVEGDKHDYCKLMISHRNEGIWSDPEILPLCLPNVNYGQPCLIESDSVLVFAAVNGDGAGGDLWYAVWDGQTWSNPDLMPETINTPFDEFFPTSDGDTLYFSSNRDDGMGGLDLFKTYLSAEGKWSKPIRLPPPYNSGGDDFSLLIDRTSPRNLKTVQQGYFTSSRGNEGRDELYGYRFYQSQTDIPAAIENSKNADSLADFDIYLALKVVTPLYKNDDPNDLRVGKTAVPFAQVFIKESGVRTQFRADKNGLVLTNLLPEKVYEIVVGKDSFLVSKIEMTTQQIRATDNGNSVTINKEVELHKVYKGKEIVLNNIYYEYDKWNITEEAKPALDALSTMLKSNPSISIELVSHTDCRGEVEYNEILSQKRAKSAVEYLVEKGISIERLVPVGMGESRLFNNCPCDACTETEHLSNRRTTFKIL